MPPAPLAEAAVQDPSLAPLVRLVEEARRADDGTALSDIQLAQLARHLEAHPALQAQGRPRAAARWLPRGLGLRLSFGLAPLALMLVFGGAVGVAATIVTLRVARGPEPAASDEAAPAARRPARAGKPRPRALSAAATVDSPATPPAERAPIEEPASALPTGTPAAAPAPAADLATTPGESGPVAEHQPAAPVPLPGAATRSGPALGRPALLATPGPRGSAPRAAPVAPPDTAPAPMASAPPSRTEREAQALAHAVNLLRRHRDPRAALHALDACLAEFPGGTLSGEARLARIEALAALGLHAQARGELDSLRARHPELAARGAAAAGAGR